MNDLFGVLDALFGLSIVAAMVTNHELIRYRFSYKIGLWLIAMGMIYHSVRNFAPEYFYNEIMVEMSHVGLWLIIGLLLYNYWKKKAASPT